MPAIATAQGRWRVILDDARGRISLDTTTVRTYPNGMYGTWVRYEYTHAMTSDKGKPFRSAMNHIYIQCTDGTIGTGAVEHYDAAMNVVASYPDLGAGVEPMSLPVPDTYGEIIVKSFCALYGKL
jgi:hypothetical protein